jgi:hypothetical protein
VAFCLPTFRINDLVSLVGGLLTASTQIVAALAGVGSNWKRPDPRPPRVPLCKLLRDLAPANGRGSLLRRPRYYCCFGGVGGLLAGAAVVPDVAFFFFFFFVFGAVGSAAGA